MSFLRLEKRGISEQAKVTGWQSQSFKSRAGWAFPVYEPLTGAVIATRWKSAQSGGMKYAWIPSKPDSPSADWYVLPETKLAISNENGIAYLANGEPALLAYQSAGVKNVIATTLSEVGIPKNLLSALTDLGITRLLYPIDNDAAGEKSAINWRDALRASAIDFEAFSWGEDAPSKADANDIWIQVNFDSDAFIARLKELRPLSLPLPEIEAQFDETDFEQTPQGLINTLANRLGVNGWKSNGWSRKNISSPFRDDKHPSATFNRNSGVLHDFGSGESYSPIEIAEQLGIDWKSYYPQRKLSKPRPQFIDSDAPITVPFFKAEKIVNMPYISDLSLNELGQTNLIRSPLATGKTSLISKIIQNADPMARILVITHLQALAENISERLSAECDYTVECYHQIPYEYRKTPHRLVCSYDSLHTIRDDWDYVFIDEHEQFHRHLTGGTMRDGEPLRAYTKLMTIVKGAEQVTVLDAHMSIASTTWLQKMRGDVTTIMNSYTHQWDTLSIQKSESGLLAEAFSAAFGNTKGIVIPTNSRSKSLDYYQLAINLFGEEAVMLINGENSSSRDARQFIKQLTHPENKGKALNTIFPDLRILICSPSLATGIDVQAEVSGVYGVFTQQPWVNACNILQMMMRYRQANVRQMCVMGSAALPEKGINRENTMKDALILHKARMSGTASAAHFKQYGLNDFDSTQELITIFSALFESETKHQQQSLHFFVEIAAEAEGFTVERSEESNSGIREALKLARKERGELFKQTVLSTTVVSPEEFDTLRQNPDATSEELRTARAGLERWHIEFVSGQTITGELFGLLGSSRKRTDFNRLIDVLDNPDSLKKRDRDEAKIGVLVIQRKHFIRNRDLIDMAGQSVLGDKWLHSDEKLTTEEIAQRMETFLRMHINEIQQYIDRRFDLSEEPINIFRRLLKRVGLQLGRTQIMRDGVRYYLYFIDGKHRKTVLGHASIALEARQIRELLQTRLTLINIREWRNQSSQRTIPPKLEPEPEMIPL